MRHQMKAVAPDAASMAHHAELRLNRLPIRIAVASGKEARSGAGRDGRPLPREHHQQERRCLMIEAYSVQRQWRAIPPQPRNGRPAIVKFLEFGLLNAVCEMRNSIPISEG